MSNKLRKVVYSVAAIAMVLGSVFAFSAPKALAAPAYDYEYITQSPISDFASVAPGEVKTFWIEVKNTGTQSWYNTGANPVRLGTGSMYGNPSQQRDYTSEVYDSATWVYPNRATNILHPEIKPGWHTRLQFQVKAPSVAGDYKAYFTPVVEGLTWMKDIGIYLPVKVVGESNNNNNNGNVATGVNLSSDTPAASTVLKAATGVSYMKFTVQQSATVNEIVVKRVGVGSSSDFSNVYLYDGSTRLTNGRSVSSDTNSATFYGLNLNASSGRVLTLKADISASAGTSNQSAFEVSSINGNTVNNVRGNTMTIGSTAISGVTLAENSASWSETLGKTGAEVAKFSLDASSATNDVVLYGITLRNAGSLSNSYITNMKLSVGSTQLASTSSMNGDKAIFTLSTPYTITKGMTKYFTVAADLTGGRSAEDIKFYLDYNADLDLKDSVYGFGINLTNNWASGDQTVSMLGGTVTLAFNGPAVTTYAKNTTQNLFVDTTVTTARNITVRKSKVKMEVLNGGTNELYGAANFGYLKNIRIVDLNSGATVAGPLAAANSGTCVLVNDADSSGTCTTGDTVYYSYEFTDQFDLSAGVARKLGIKADIDNAFTVTSRTIKLSLDLSGSNYLYDNGSSQYLATSDIVPSSITGNAMNVGTDGMTVALSSTPVSSTAVKNSKDIAAVGYLFKSGDTNSSKISKLIVTGQGDLGSGYGAGNLDDIVAALNLYVDGVKVAGPVSVNSSGVATFNSLNVTIDAGQTKRFEVYADVSSTAGAGDDDYFWLGINAATDITVENGSGSSFNAAAADGTWSSNETNATPTVAMLIRSAGTLVSALDAGSPLSKIAVAGSTNNEILKIKYTTQYEGFKITKIKLGLDSDDNGTADSSSDNNVDSVVLTNGTNTYTGYVSGGFATFTGLDFQVAKDTSSVVTAKINYKTIANGATSGAKVELIYDANSGFEAIGSGSGTTITDSTTDVTAGGIMVVRKTQPTIANPTQSSSVLSNAELDLLQFTVAAASGADVAIKQLAFDTALNEDGDSVMTITGIKLYKNGTQVDAANISVIAGADANLAEGETVLIISWKTNKEELVSAGSTATFVLKGTVSGTDTGDSFLVRVADEQANVVTGAVTDGGAVANYLTVGALTEAQSGMIWSDNSSYSHNATIGSSSSDWTNGHLVDTLPSTYYSWSR